jgi:hypothetical protein
MDEGLPIRENPSLQTISVNRFIAVAWDGRELTLTFGKASKLPKRMGDKTPGEAVVYPTAAVALQPEVAAELVGKLTAILQMLGSKPN